MALLEAHSTSALKVLSCTMMCICYALVFLLLATITHGYKIPSRSSQQIRNSGRLGRKVSQTLQLKLKDNVEVLPETDFDYSTELKRTGLWVASAAGFAGIVAATKGVDSAVEFCSGYVLEQCLSVDNLFVFIVLFEYFKVSKDKQDRVLSFGIWGGKRKFEKRFENWSFLQSKRSIFNFYP